MSTYRMPDGKLYSFPDEMPKEEIRQIASKKFPNQIPPRDDLLTTAGKGISTFVPAMQYAYETARTLAGETARDFVDPVFDQTYAPREGLTPEETRKLGSAPFVAKPGAPVEEYLNQPAPITMKAWSPGQYLPEETKLAIAKNAAMLSVGSQLQAQKALTETPKANVAPGSFDEFAFNLAAAVPDIGISLAAGAAAIPTRGASLAALAPYFAAKAGGPKYAEARKAGLSHDQALGAAVVVGATEGAMEALSGLVFGAKLGGSLLGTVLRTGAVEGLTEGATEGINILVDMGVLRQDMTLEEAVSRLQMAAAVGTVGGGTVGGAIRLATGPGVRPDDKAAPTTEKIVETDFGAPAGVDPGIAETLGNVAAQPLAIEREKRLALPPPSAIEDIVSPIAERQQTIKVMPTEEQLAQKASDRTRAVIGAARETATPIGTFSMNEVGNDVAGKVRLRRMRTGRTAPDAPVSVADMQAVGVDRSFIDALIIGRKPLTGEQLTAANRPSLESRAVPAGPFTEEQYSASVAATRTAGRFSIDGVRKAAVSSPRVAKLIRDEMVTRGDLVPGTRPGTFKPYERPAAPATQSPLKTFTVAPVASDTIAVKKDGKVIGVFEDQVAVKNAVRGIREREKAEQNPPSRVEVVRGGVDAEGKAMTERPGFAVYENRYDDEGKLVDRAIVSTHVAEDAARAQAENLTARPAPQPSQPGVAAPTGPRPSVIARSRPQKIPTPKVLEGRVQEVVDKLNEQANKRALPLIGNRVLLTGTITDAAGNADIEGSYLKQLTTLAVDRLDPNMSTDDVVEALAGVMDHETIHALREAGVLAPGTKAWSILSNYVVQAKHPDTGLTYIETAIDRNPDLADRPDVIVEEAIAEAFRAWAANRRAVAGVPRTALEKIVEWFKRLVSSVPDDVFRSIETGTLARSRIKAPLSYRGAAVEKMEKARADLETATTPEQTLAAEREFLQAREQAAEDRVGRVGPRSVLGTTPSDEFMTGPRASFDRVEALLENAKTTLNKAPSPNRGTPDNTFLMKLADAYDKAPHEPSNTAVSKAYSSLVAETKSFFNALNVTVVPWRENGQPYLNQRELIDDMADNGQVKMRLSNDLFPPHPSRRNHPMQEPSGFTTEDGSSLSNGDLLRVVAEAYGYAPVGAVPSMLGDYRAYSTIKDMYSPQGQRALATEMLAHSAWQNTGPKMRLTDGSIASPDALGFVPPNMREFAEQKATLLPPEALVEPVQPREDILDMSGIGDETRYSREAKRVAGVDLDNAPEGWGSVNNLPEQLTAQEREALTEIVRKVSGLSDVRWYDRIKVDRYDEAWGKQVSEATGFYDPTADVIALTTQWGNPKSAYHEAFHRLQWVYLTDKERAFLRAEEPTLRDMMRKYGGRGEVADKMQLSELEAETFGLWATGIMPAPTGLAGAWKKIKDTLARVANYLSGLGYRIPEDIYAAAKRGDIAARTPSGRAARDAVKAERAAASADIRYSRGMSYGPAEQSRLPSRAGVTADKSYNVGSPEFYAMLDEVVPGGKYYGNPKRAAAAVTSPADTSSPAFSQTRDGNAFFGGDVAYQQLQMARDGDRGAVLIYLHPEDFLRLANTAPVREQDLYTAAANDGLKFNTLPSLVVESGKVGAVPVLNSDGVGMARALLGKAKSIPVVLYPSGKGQIENVDTLTANGNVVDMLGMYEFDISRRGPRQGLSTIAFNSWFKQSAVVDETGAPKRVYHTTSPDRNFGVFDTQASEFGSHFGTVEQANLRGSKRGHSYPAYLSIQNPLRLVDKASFDNETVAKQLLDLGVIDEDAYKAVTDNTVNGRVALQDAVMDAGYDGVVYLNRGESAKVSADFPGMEFMRTASDAEFSARFPDVQDSYIIFQPTQVKSAIANRGTWSAADPDIRYSRGRPRARVTPHGGMVHRNIYDRVQGWFSQNLHNLGRSKKALPLVGSIFDLRVNFQDNFLPIKEYYDELVRKGLPIPADLNAYIVEQSVGSAAAFQVQQRERDYVQPLTKAMKDGIQAKRFTYDDVIDFLYALHAPERNAYLRARGSKKPDPSGMTDAAAAKVIAGAKAVGTFTKLMEISRMASNIVADINQTRLATGQITADVLAASPFQHWVPLRDTEDVDPHDDITNAPRADGVGRGFTAWGKRVDKRMFGRTSKAGDILANLVALQAVTVTRGERARVGKAIVETVRQAEAAGLPSSLKEIKSPVKKLAYGADGMIREIADPDYRHDARYTVFKVDGKEVVLETTDLYISEALKSPMVEQFGKLMQLMTWVRRTYTALITSRNPNFVLTNFVRDAQEALINATQYDVKNLIPKMVGSIPQAAIAISEYQLNQKAPPGSGKMTRHYEEMVQNGWIVSFLAPTDLATTINKLRRDAGALEGSKAVVAKAGQAVDYALAKWDGLNNVAEGAMRLTLYSAMRDAGASITEAGVAAKNLTINFNKGGKYKQLMDTGYLFASVVTNGMAVAGSALKSKSGLGILTGVIGMAVVLDALNRAASDDEDENGVKDYDQMSEDELARNIILPVHKFGIPGITQPLKIPMAIGVYGAIFNLGRNVSRAIDSMTNPRQPIKVDGAMGRAVTAMVGALSPIGNSSNPAVLVSPWFVDPLVELISNKNWADMDIVPPTYDETKPMSERFYRTTDATFVWAAQTLNGLTGGNSVRKGSFDFSPEHLQYWFEFATAGTGKFVLDAKYMLTDAPAALLAGEEVDLGKIPVIKRFVTGTSTRRGAQDLYYEIEGEVKTTENELEDRDLRAAGKTRIAASSRVRSAFDRADKQLKDLRKKLRAAMDNKTMTQTARLKKVSDIRDDMTEVMNRAVSAYYDEAEKKAKLN